jgi:hypothetical protein
MDIKYPDYNNSIVNLVCSVLKNYGAECQHQTLSIFDNYLKKEYKNVVVMLFDGLGVDALENHIDKGIAYSHESVQFLSNHAGMTKQGI